VNNLDWFKSIFLKYLKRAKQERASFADFLTQLFRTKYRSIDTMECTQDHELRGALWVDSKPVEGLIDRRVLTMRKGQRVWLRDDAEEAFVTLENSRGVVNIRRTEWNYKYARYYK
jgi:hypothetical protein